jgi:hypothetical protein
MDPIHHDDLRDISVKPIWLGTTAETLTAQHGIYDDRHPRLYEVKDSA